MLSVLARVSDYDHGAFIALVAALGWSALVGYSGTPWWVLSIGLLSAIVCHVVGAIARARSAKFAKQIGVKV